MTECTIRCNAGVAQLVEFQPSKLAVEGSNPFSRSMSKRYSVVLVPLLINGIANASHGFIRRGRRKKGKNTILTSEYMVDF